MYIINKYSYLISSTDKLRGRHLMTGFNWCLISLLSAIKAFDMKGTL